MGLQSALTTALTGLQAAETTIDVVGNNVANSQTVGFKESSVVFATQFSQTISIGTGPTGTLGGTNPRQVGLGAKVAEIAPKFSQGTVEISSSPLDVAIQGDGFLVVQGTQGRQYTRNGQLNINAQNEIVTTTGQRLLGYGVDENYNVQRTTLVPLTIPIGSAAVAEATRNVFLAGNLNPTADYQAVQPGIIQSTVLSNGEIEFPPDLAANDVAPVVPPNASSIGVVANTGAGNIGAGTYNYRIVYVDAQGNEASPSSAFGNITTTGAAGVDEAIDLTTLPAPTASESHFTTKRIYRTDATGAGDFKLVGSVAAAATSFTDTVADGSLGAVLDDTSVDRAAYSYYVTYYNTSNGLESRPTSKIGPISISDDGRSVRLAGIVPPTSGDFNAVRIYRNTQQGFDSYGLVETIPTSGSSPISYIDRTPDAVVEAASETLDINGPAISTGLELVHLTSFDGNGYRNLFPPGGGTISFSGKKGGVDLPAKDFEYTDTTTVQELINFMDQALGIHNAGSDPTNPLPGTPGAAVTGDSRLQFTSNFGAQNELFINPSAFRITPNGASASQSVTLRFDKTQEASLPNKTGAGATAEFVVYDTLGLPVSVSVSTYLEDTDGNSFTYRWLANSPDNEPDATGSNVDTTVGSGTITFNGDGDIISVSNASVAIERRITASTSPLSFELDFSQLSGLAIGDGSSLAAVQQDGSPPGVLSSFVITDSGAIRGIFSNGNERTLGQMQLARFANNSGLSQQGDNLWGAGVNSGLAVLSDPGSQGVGTLTAGAVELSNTDIGQNLIDLILASTQYRGGARVISAAQELLDELLALRR
ncbi:Flagellar hook protein FlgE [Pirellulimonas nuda]|uniref:Flagellar hook protein FlgE n=1 Tax=Pirellulimonas nuda TaxID=2528009 RepID=A0A518D9Q7_9BACT|nr:flagellar hook-basal body complex protein [Pirellulimonas nuda]QDU88227.1 Flagellar hook protein FlgE [Pirellulimonas nuda]